jgi:hypothetical protein
MAFVLYIGQEMPIDTLITNPPDHYYYLRRTSHIILRTPVRASLYAKIIHSRENPKKGETEIS